MYFESFSHSSTVMYSKAFKIFSTTASQLHSKLNPSRDRVDSIEVESERRFTCIGPILCVLIVSLVKNLLIVRQLSENWGWLWFQLLRIELPVLGYITILVVLLSWSKRFWFRFPLFVVLTLSCAYYLADSVVTVALNARLYLDDLLRFLPEVSAAKSFLKIGRAHV